MIPITPEGIFVLALAFAAALSGGAALVIALGFKKVHPLLGGWVCAVIYLGTSICAIFINPELLVSSGDGAVALLVALVIHVFFAVAVLLAAALVIFVIRKQ